MVDLRHRTERGREADRTISCIIFTMINDDSLAKEEILISDVNRNWGGGRNGGFKLL